jgi:RNA polymerase sigma-70 factor (ECF subfamily)
MERGFPTALWMCRLPNNDASTGTEEIASIVPRILAGDSSAFEQIVIRYERRVLTLALRLLQSRDDAQDAAQEVFLRAFKYIHRLDLAKPIGPWLMRITVNVCRDIGRQRQQRRITFPEMTLPDDSSADASSDPYREVAEEQRRKMLWRALHKLPQKERLAVILRDVEGLSTAEVAVILRSSETTVRSQVSRGRLRMKEAIDGMTGGPK